MSSSKLAIDHWNKTPLFLSEEERYSLYPWLYEAAEFKSHAGHLFSYFIVTRILAGFFLVAKGQKPF